MRNFISFVSQSLFVFLISAPFLGSQLTYAQDHVVPSSELQKDLAGASATRQKNQAQLEEFIASPEAQHALKTAHVNDGEVKNAISKLSDDEMAQLSARSEKAEKDFSAGRLSDRDLIIILVAIAVLILIIVAVR